MPYMQLAVLRANEVFAGVEGHEPQRLRADLGDARTVRATGEALGLFDVLEERVGAGLREYLDRLPAGLDAAMVAALHSALERGLRTQLVWQPGYDFELRMWEVSEGTDGVLTMMIVSPHPPE